MKFFGSKIGDADLPFRDRRTESFGHSVRSVGSPQSHPGSFCFWYGGRRLIIVIC